MFCSVCCVSQVIVSPCRIFLLVLIFIFIYYHYLQDRCEEKPALTMLYTCIYVSRSISRRFLVIARYSVVIQVFIFFIADVLYFWIATPPKAVRNDEERMGGRNPAPTGEVGNCNDGWMAGAGAWPYGRGGELQ